MYGTPLTIFIFLQMIPQKFVRKYRKQLHVGVHLSVPRGAVWHVDLVGDGDKVWLQNGWPEFARFYSLSFGHFLVFKYQGNSRFDVFIYDSRGTEIDYPMVSTVPHLNNIQPLDMIKPKKGEVNFHNTHQEGVLIVE